MEDNLVGYLLGALDADSQRSVEKYLDDEPGARQRLETLRRALAPLEVDKDSIDPPPLLTVRTLGRVAEYRCRPLPAAPPPPVRFASGRVWWRRGDVLAAACLLVLVGGLGTTWVRRTQAEHQRVACQRNLGLFANALQGYASKQGGDLPRIEKGNPRYVAASYLPMLKEAGVLPADASVRCPANGAPLHDVPSLSDLADLPDEKMVDRLGEMPGCYAYTLGHMHNGVHAGPRLQPALYNSTVLPVMADRPTIGDRPEVRDSSPNHAGQNVLFLDGNVRYLKKPFRPFTDPKAPDHIFLNHEGKVAAGVDQWDSVLGWGTDRP